MATVTRVNPASEAVDFNNTGRNLVHMDIAFAAAVDAKLGPNSAVKATLEAISQITNIVLAGDRRTEGLGRAFRADGYG